MKPTRSKHPGDCGVCTVATILSISWNDSADLIYPNGWSPEDLAGGTHTAEIIAALNTHKKNTVLQPYMNPLPNNGDRWQHVPKDKVTLLHVSFGPELGYHHWAVYDGSLVYDSNFPMAMTVDKYKDLTLQHYGFKVRVNSYLPIEL